MSTLQAMLDYVEQYRDQVMDRYNLICDELLNESEVKDILDFYFEAYAGYLSPSIVAAVVPVVDSITKLATDRIVTANNSPIYASYNNPELYLTHLIKALAAIMRVTDLQGVIENDWEYTDFEDLEVLEDLYRYTQDYSLHAFHADCVRTSYKNLISEYGEDDTTSLLYAIFELLVYTIIDRSLGNILTDKYLEHAYKYSTPDNLMAIHFVGNVAIVWRVDGFTYRVVCVEYVGQYTSPELVEDNTQG